MKRSEINRAVRQASTAFRKHGWALPPKPKWDVTDFGLGHFKKCGLTLVNLAEEKEYCEKVMFVRKNQVTPRHFHKAKKEDIICRYGKLAVEFHPTKKSIAIQVNGEKRTVDPKKLLILKAGERITITQRLPHAFWAATPYAIVGEVSTANDDTNDNFFENRDIGRFSKIDENEKPLVKLVSD